MMLKLKMGTEQTVTVHMPRVVFQDTNTCKYLD